MAVKKQPESGAGELTETANDWFRQFVKLLELFIVKTGQGLPSDARATDYRLAAMRAVKLTLVDSGIDDDEIVNLFGRVALEDTNAPTQLEWNTELNKRRFELIDGDIQGRLSQAEQIELAGFPEDLPNLSHLRPPRNSRPQGVEISWYAKRQRGQLAETY